MHAVLLALPLLLSADPVVQRDITYATLGGEKLQLDITRPSTPGPHPCVLCFHGGAWKYGHRRDVTAFTADLAKQGYAAAAVSYRLAPKHKWPAQIIDAKTAVRYLRANADQYDLDPQRISALGFSAGGHLAALLGTTGNDSDFEGDLYREHSSEVQCVVDFFGPADLSLFSETPGIEAAYFKPLFGKLYRAEPELYKKASPIEYCHDKCPPFLILHGTADIIVPVIHSERFHDKLLKAGVKSELFKVRGGGHGWGGEDAERTTQVTLKFLNEQFLAESK